MSPATSPRCTAVASRKLVLTASDDGQAVHFQIELYETIGGVEIGPKMVFETTILAFPAPVVEEWMRDMAVQMVEYL
jgi:hypothetical protein